MAVTAVLADSSLLVQSWELVSTLAPQQQDQPPLPPSWFDEYYTNPPPVLEQQLAPPLLAQEEQYPSITISSLTLLVNVCGKVRPVRWGAGCFAHACPLPDSSAAGMPHAKRAARPFTWLSQATVSNVTAFRGLLTADGAAAARTDANNTLEALHRDCSWGKVRVWSEGERLGSRVSKDATLPFPCSCHTDPALARACLAPRA